MIEETKFAKTWFPMFINYFAGKEAGIAAAWATNVAGNFYKDVYVVDNVDNPQKIHFVVPSLFTRDNAVLPDHITQNLGIILAQANAQENVFPVVVNIYLPRALRTMWLNP